MGKNKFGMKPSKTTDVKNMGMVKTRSRSVCPVQIDTAKKAETN